MASCVWSMSVRLPCPSLCRDLTYTSLSVVLTHFYHLLKSLWISTSALVPKLHLILQWLLLIFVTCSVQTKGKKTNIEGNLQVHSFCLIWLEQFSNNMCELLKEYKEAFLRSHVLLVWFVLWSYSARALTCEQGTERLTKLEKTNLSEASHDIWEKIAWCFLYLTGDPFLWLCAFCFSANCTSSASHRKYLWCLQGWGPHLSCGFLKAGI